MFAICILLLSSIRSQVVEPEHSGSRDVDLDPKWIVIQIYGDNYIGKLVNMTKLGQADLSQNGTTNHTDADHHEESFVPPEHHEDEDHHGDDGDHIGHVDSQAKTDIWFMTLTINGALAIILFAIAWLRKKAHLL